jgi:hypothetical protein
MGRILEFKMKDLRTPKFPSYNIKEGQYVKFVGCTREQVNWGNNTDPENLLVPGGIYYVEQVIIKSSHTKLILRGVGGKFNSVCFESLGNGSF